MHLGITHVTLQPYYASGFFQVYMYIQLLKLLLPKEINQLALLGSSFGFGPGNSLSHCSEKLRVLGVFG